MKTPEEKILLMMPKLLKTIKKTLPQVRSRYAAMELKNIAVMIATELKQTKIKEPTN